MKLEPFDRNKVKAGDRMVMAQFHSVDLIFKFMGHDGDVVATLDGPGPPRDVIFRQRDVLMEVAE